LRNSTPDSRKQLFCLGLTAIPAEMSIELKKLVDVRIDGGAATSVIHDAVLGGSNVVRAEFQATSSTASNIDFVIQTPGLGVFMSRRVNVRTTIPMKFTVKTGAIVPAAGVSLVWGQNFGVGAFPLNTLITSATVQISTSNFNTQVQQTLPLIKRLMQRPDIREKLSDVPTELGVCAALFPAEYNVNSPFADRSSSYSGAMGNCAMPQWQFTKVDGVAHGDPNSVLIPSANQTVQIEGILSVDEPLLIQPFTFDDEVPAFINTNLINVRLNLSGVAANLARIFKFSLHPSSVVANRTVISNMQWNTDQSVSPSPYIYTTFITPPVSAKPPEKAIYPTQFFNPLGTVGGAIAPADFKSRSLNAVEIDSQVITLNTAPDMLAIYAVPDFQGMGMDGTTGAGTAGVYDGACFDDMLLCIDKLQITWNNNPSLLATFNSRELWRRTKQNGLDTPYPVYSGAVIGTASDWTAETGRVAPVASMTGTYASSGGCILLALNKDIPVEAGVAAGVAGVYTLKVRANVYNQLGVAVPKFTLYVVPITSQYLVLNVGATSDLINTVATESVVYSTPVTGDVQDKRTLVDDRGGLPGGFMAASGRGSLNVPKLIDMTAKGPQMASVTGAGAGSYVSGAKRAYGAM
jgi:hypothetical protein